MKRLIPICSLILLLIAVLPIQAAGRIFGNNNGGSCNTGYCAPTYYAPQATYIYRDVIQPVAYPVPFTVAVPVVSYFPNNVSYSPVFAAQPAMPAVVASTMTSAAPGQMMTRAEWSDAQLDSLIDKLEKRLAARQVAAGNQQASVPNTVSSAPPPVPSHNGSVDLVLKTNCSSCHSGAAAKGKMMMFDGQGNLNSNVNKQAIWDAADTGRMPPAAQKDVRLALTDGDVAVLRSWMLSR